MTSPPPPATARSPCPGPPRPPPAAPPSPATPPPLTPTDTATTDVATCTTTTTTCTLTPLTNGDKVHIAVTATNTVGTSTPSPRQTATPLAPAPTFRDSSVYQGNVSSATVTVPRTVQEGDTLVAFLSINTTASATTPSGWDLVGEQPSGSMKTYAYSRTARPSDAGAAVTFKLGTISKTDLTVLAYTGTGASNPISAWASAGETVTQAAHTAPSLASVPSGATVITYWADKSSTTTSWAPPGNLRLRSKTFGSANGRISALSGDSTTSDTTWKGLSATTNAANNKATMWSIALTR